MKNHLLLSLLTTLVLLPAHAASPAPMKTPSSPPAFVPPQEQLIVEVYVRDLRASLRVLEELGFRIGRREDRFAVLEWESSSLFLEEIPGLPTPASQPVANVRIMVPDVDRSWELVRRLAVRVLKPIDNRYYGLRDFTVVTPDGIGLRFASPLPSPAVQHVPEL